MKKLLYSLISIWFCLGSTVLSQNPEWINYTNGHEVNSVVIDGDNIWAGTNGGLVKLNKTTGEITFYNKANSGLPDNDVRSLAIDGSGNKWIGTYDGGLAKFDGKNWTVYNTSNSGLPDNIIACHRHRRKRVISGLGLMVADWQNLMAQTGLFIILLIPVCRIIVFVPSP